MYMHRLIGLCPFYLLQHQICCGSVRSLFHTNRRCFQIGTKRTIIGRVQLKKDVAFGLRQSEQN